MLRGFVIGLSLLALAGGLLGMLAGAGPGMVGPMIFGLLLLVGTEWNRLRRRASAAWYRCCPDA